MSAADGRQPMQPAQALAAAVEATGRIVAGVRPVQMTDPTPCARFDVRALLNHIVGGQRALVVAGNGGRGESPPMGLFPDVVGDDPSGAYEESSKLLVELFSDPATLDQTFALAVDVPGRDALGIAIMEAVVHGWDLATATKQQPLVDPALAEMLLAAAAGFVTDRFRSGDGHPFAQPVEVAVDAPVVDRLVAFLGRAP